MNKSDFIFDRIEGGKYCDYWFRVIGETKTELTNRYMEQSMIEVSEVSFSIQDGQIGVKKLFPFNNYSVVTNPKDKELQKVLEEVAFETFRKMNMKG